MGIALPKWVVEGQNNVYVLGVYAMLFGLLLPYFVVGPHALSGLSGFCLLTRSLSEQRAGGGMVQDNTPRIESTTIRWRLSSGN